MCGFVHRMTVSVDLLHHAGVVQSEQLEAPLDVSGLHLLHLPAAFNQCISSKR